MKEMLGRPPVFDVWGANADIDSSTTRIDGVWMVSFLCDIAGSNCHQGSWLSSSCSVSSAHIMDMGKSFATDHIFPNFLGGVTACGPWRIIVHSPLRVLLLLDSKKICFNWVLFIFLMTLPACKWAKAKFHLVLIQQKQNRIWWLKWEICCFT